MRATLELLRERGYSGLTTKEVAARAGFSNGALMHHFSTKADLVIAAGAHIYEQHIESGRKIANSAAARKDPLKAFIADCEDVYLGAAFIPTTEMMVAARSDPLMNAPFDAFMRQLPQDHERHLAEGLHARRLQRGAGVLHHHVDALCHPRHGDQFDLAEEPALLPILPARMDQDRAIRRARKRARIPIR